MAWVFICIAAGAAGFLVFIVIDYRKVTAGLKHKPDLAKVEIRECEAKIDAEQNATKDTKEQVAALQKEIEDLEKELTELQEKVDEYREREKRRKPTKFKLEE
ncbi:MAG: hypothetical protein VCF24_04955 [Candidatus Latescibacterota bacterium]